MWYMVACLVLVQDLLGKTETNHPDHSVLTKALELYEDVMTYLDADITEDEQRKKFMRMSNIRGAQVRRILACDLGRGVEKNERRKRMRRVGEFAISNRSPGTH